MRSRELGTFAQVLGFFLVTGACGAPATDDGAGGAATGGAASGAAGAAAGGKGTAGTAPGGAPAGGASTGGTPAGGTLTGGAAGSSGARADGGGGSGAGAAGSGGSSTGGSGGSAGASGGAGGGKAGDGGAAGTGKGGAGGGGGTSGGRGGAGGASGGKAGSTTGGSAGAGGPVTVFLAGDSTVSTYTNTASPNDQAGWGQMFDALFDTRVTVQNRASGGQTARRFIDENRLAPILSALRAGDYFLIQFGTNDGNRTASYTLNGQSIPYYLEPATDFKTYLRKYIEGARTRGATPVLVTPPPRNSAYCTGGNGTGAHATAMRELGAAENVAVSDLNAKSVAYLRAICPSPTPENFFLVRADGTVDGTHFQENGARILAGFVAAGLEEAGVPLAQYLL
jgi:lysophospholipase L1-like esterase